MLTILEVVRSEQYEHIDISPAIAIRMQQMARQLRKTPTPSETILWAAIRGRQLDGRKFRRQVSIGAFVVDLYCWTEKLVIEVDGAVHELQRGADAERQTLVESLGLRFIRFSAEEIEGNLPAILNRIKATFRSMSK